MHENSHKADVILLCFKENTLLIFFRINNIPFTDSKTEDKDFKKMRKIIHNCVQVNRAPE